MASAPKWFSVSLEKQHSSAVNRIGWLLIVALSLVFIYTNALRYFDFTNPIFQHRLQENQIFAPLLMIHVAGGVIALLLGPFQFSSTVRHRYIRLHRLMGLTYLLCILFSGIVAIYLAIAHNLFIKHRFVWSVGAVCMGLTWLFTSGMAFWAIKQRQFSQHKEWMIRSYVLTGNFIIYRLIFYGLHGIAGFRYKDQISDLTIWASWTVPLLITEFIMQSKKLTAVSAKQKMHQPV